MSRARSRVALNILEIYYYYDMDMDMRGKIM